MRDPDLVMQAQGAATALERAWDRYRTLHGLGSDPMPAISSYVGYSLEEPWGAPRVVFVMKGGVVYRWDGGKKGGPGPASPDRKRGGSALEAP